MTQCSNDVCPIKKECLRSLSSGIILKPIGKRKSIVTYMYKLKDGEIDCDEFRPLPQSQRSEKMTKEYRNILDKMNKERNEAANNIRDELNALKELWETSDCVVAMEDIRKSFHILTGKQINQTELFDVLDGLQKKR